MNDSMDRHIQLLPLSTVMHLKILWMLRSILYSVVKKTVQTLLSPISKEMYIGSRQNSYSIQHHCSDFFPVLLLTGGNGTPTDFGATRFTV